MSSTAMNAFMTEASTNAAFAERLRSAISEHEGADAIEAVGALARDAGFDVRNTDVEVFRERALVLLEDGELSEEKLDGVAGGVIGIDDVLLGGAILGVICAAAGTVGLTGAAIGTRVIGGVISKDFGDKITDFFNKW
jgi:predicted ribosomally synthesized peptide with nif11-like leader